MRILEMCVDLDGGGVDRYLLNYCSRIRDIRFDFVIIEKKKKGILEDSIQALGGSIYKVPRQSAGVIKYFLSVMKIMKGNDYQAVHVHFGYRSFLPLLCAFLCGIRTRIVHAHIAFEPESLRELFFRKTMTVLVKLLATSLVSCGEDAGRWVWGNRLFDKKRVTVLNNAVQVFKYRYSSKARELLRRELRLEPGVTTIGHVGRLSDQKNQPRVIEIFAEILRKEPNARLLLIGQGEQEEILRTKISDLGLEERVSLLSVRDDVHLLLNAMDVFVFPSKYEGLPFTLVETQCNGLHAICSDVITKQVCVSECLHFLSLSSPDSLWADEAIHFANRGHDELAWKKVQKAGYDIDVEADKLKRYYISCVEKKNGRYGNHSK